MCLLSSEPSALVFFSDGKVEVLLPNYKFCSNVLQGTSMSKSYNAMVHHDGILYSCFATGFCLNTQLEKQEYKISRIDFFLGKCAKFDLRTNNPSQTFVELSSTLSSGRRRHSMEILGTKVTTPFLVE